MVNSKKSEQWQIISTELADMAPRFVVINFWCFSFEKCNSALHWYKKVHPGKTREPPYLSPLPSDLCRSEWAGLLRIVLHRSLLCAGEMKDTHIFDIYFRQSFLWFRLGYKMNIICAKKKRRNVPSQTCLSYSAVSALMKPPMWLWCTRRL